MCSTRSVPDFLGHGLVAREIAEQAIVLLKNENNFLPLNPANIKSVALIGARVVRGHGEVAAALRSGRQRRTSLLPITVTPQEGLENVLRAMGSSATVTYNSAGGPEPKRIGEAAVELAKKSDVVIVMVGDNPHELCDRETLRPADHPAGRPELLCVGRIEARRSHRPAAPTGSEATGTTRKALMRELIAAPGVAQKMVVVLKTEGHGSDAVA